MKVKFGKSLISKWYRHLIMAVLTCLLMAPLTHAETAPDTTDVEVWPQLAGKWGPMMALRDDSDTWSERKPNGGWWIGPIHATLLPDGKVIVSGLSRREEKRVYFGFDHLHSSGENGTSFVLDPSDVKQNASDTFYVTPVNEGGELHSGGPPGPGQRDVLFCSGHTPIGNGQVLFTGGSRMENLAQPDQKSEQGLDYARVYDAGANEFRTVSSRKGELYRFAGETQRHRQMWYPTSIRLADDRVLTMAGFYEGRYDTPYGFNLSLHLFDPKKLAQDQNPHSLLVAHEDSVPYLRASESDYVQMVLLPQPLDIDGTTYEVAMIATSGHLVLLDVDADSPKRFHVLTHRPSGNCHYQSGRRSSMLLGPSGKQLIVIGGFKDGGLECDVARRADFYHLEHRIWYSADLKIARQFPTATLLPTGIVLIANGGGIVVPSPGRPEPGPKGTDLKIFPGVDRPQLLDPEAHYAYTLEPWNDDPSARGYHGISLLMKDASVLIAGGFSHDGPYGVGSERPDIRIYEPYYLVQNPEKAPRPEWGNVQEPIAMTIGAKEAINIPYSGPELKEKGGVVLMATGSFTHHFDHNQRYIALDYVRNGDVLQITPPATTSIAPSGDYMIFLVSPSGLLSEQEAKFVRDFGIPSVGKHVALK